MIHQKNPGLAAPFLREEARGERLVNFARLAVTALYLGAGWGARSEIPALSLNTIYTVVGISFLYTVMLSVLLALKKYGPVVKFVSSFIDVTLLSIVLYSLGQFRTFKSEAFLIYFLWIALAAARFSVTLTLFTGILSVLSYCALIAWAFHGETILSGTIADHFTTSRVSPLNLGIRILFMTACFSAAAYVARLYRGVVAESVARESVLNPNFHLSGETRMATILFCNIRDFTRMSDGMEPEEAVRFLNAYLRMMIDVISDHGGALHKFLGDGIMAVYGVPITSGNDAEMAVKTALKMKEALSEMNEDRTTRGGEPVRIGIGIHTGEVVAGNIGSLGRLEYTVIGQTVNLASRVEALNKFLNTDMLITQRTYDQVRALVDVEKQKLVRIKGIDEPIQTYRILGGTAG